MFKKSAIFVIFCFFLLTITTSLTKNKARNLEKEILKLEKEISQIEKQISDAEIDYIYLSKPKKLMQKQVLELRCRQQALQKNYLEKTIKEHFPYYYY